MNDQNILKELREYIDSIESSISLFQMKDKFKESLNLIENHIKLTNMNEHITDFNPKIVELCIDFLIKQIIENPKMEKFYFFADQYILLVFNWNNGVFKNEPLEKRIKRISRFITNNMKLDEKHQIVNVLIKILDESNKWESPSFELSQHYFNLLKEEK